MSGNRRLPESDPPAGMDFSAVPEALQRVELELYRDNVAGALDLLERGYTATADPRYSIRAKQIHEWRSHLDDPRRYAEVYERFYHQRKGRLSLKRLERDVRTLFGRKTTRTIERMARNPEVQLLDREIVARRAERVLDGGCGEGRVAITLAARHPDLRITAIEVSRTNIRIARRVNRFSNVTFAEGLIEDFAASGPAASFDLAYSFAVLEHVADVDEVVRGITRLLRPGGRFCFVVPMNEIEATGVLPPFEPPDGRLGHVRNFSDSALRAQFGDRPDFVLTKLPGRWRSGQYPTTIAPVEYGSFFVAFSTDG